MEKIEEYNPFLERNVKYPTNDFETAVLIIKGAIGAGILAMPFAFRHTGLWMGVVATIIVVVIISYCTQILVQSSQTLCYRHRIAKLSYAETAEKAFANENGETTPVGVLMFYIVNFFIVFNLLGVVCIYFINAGRNIEQVVNLHFPDLHIEIEEYILIMAIPLSLMCLIKELKYVAYFSAIGNLVVVFALVMTFTFVFQDLAAPSDRESIVDIERWPTFLAISFFALQCIAYIIPIENEMIEPLHFTKWPAIYLWTMLAVGTIYTTVGFFGYLKFGNDIQPNITLNLPVESSWAQVVKISVAVVLYVTSAIPFYVSVQVLWGGVQKNLPKDKHSLYQTFLRIAIMLICTLIATSFPNLGAFLSIVGSLCLSFLGVLLPAAIDIMCRKNQGYGFLKCRLIIDVFIMCFGLVAAITGMTESIKDFDALVLHFSTPYPYPK